MMRWRNVNIFLLLFSALTPHIFSAVNGKCHFDGTDEVTSCLLVYNTCTTLILQCRFVFGECSLPQDIYYLYVYTLHYLFKKYTLY